ncbi:hypothetical protein V495_02482 [Pseudogymnoascus sp. VKM F-4514 (FW-929)]|nr:hypothetical protein V495_02482 [Pseudogymnoascus sp. VKM F-4514 (FW-929)]KFY54117.1 hypothetical protein V497_07999 [Pseudogymnoascus sp. VKM F-4516 (FW-969)]
MRYYDIWVLASFVSLILFALLTLIAGYKHGVLDSVSPWLRFTLPAHPTFHLLTLAIDCEQRPLGWTFRSDDLFIVHRGEINGSRPVNMKGVPIQEFKTAGLAGLLATGLVMAILAAVGFVVELFWWRETRGVAAGVARGMTTVAVFLTTSSALVTRALTQLSNDEQVVTGRNNNFLGLLWGAAAFMYVAVAGRVAAAEAE